MFLMRKSPLVWSFLFLTLLLPVISVSQTVSPISTNLPNTAESAKIKTFWLEQITQDTENLNRSEDRAETVAKIASLYWKIDQTKARQLFRESVDILLTAEQELESNQKAGKPYDLYQYNQFRIQILWIISKSDEQLAFETFIKSRPPLVTEAMEGVPLKTEELNLAGVDQFNLPKSIVDGENQTEYSLASYTIKTNPKLAIEILHRDLQDNFTAKIYPLLKSLYQKDQSAANDILQSILSRLVTADFAGNPEYFYFTSALLTDSLPQHYPLFRMPVDSVIIHQLAEKTADYLIRFAAPNHQVREKYFLSVLAEILPQRAEEIYQKVVPQIVPYKGTVIGFSSREYLDLMQEETPPEKVLSRADNYQTWERRMLYAKAASQIAESGNLSGAQKILAEHFPSDAERSYVNDSYTLRRAFYASRRGDYDRAFALIRQVSDNQQIFPLIELAEAIHKQTPTNSSQIQPVLAAALSKISMSPATGNDFMYLDRFMSATVPINPETSFKLLEVFVNQSNELDAQKIKFYKSKSTHNETVSVGSNHSFGYVHLKNFMIADADRTLKILNRFELPDTRINTELLALESVSEN